MRLVIQCPPIPEHLREGMSVPKSVQAFLTQAAAENIPQAPVGKTNLLPVTIDDKILASLPLTGDDIAVALGRYVQGVVNLRAAAAPSSLVVERVKYQQQFYNGISGPLQQGKIVLAEGATGIGKGRVLAWLAKESYEAGRGPVVIASPTVVGLKQLVEEWTKAECPASVAAVVLGKQQFIDIDALIGLLTGEDSPIQNIGEDKTQRVINWICAGCPPVAGNPNTAPLIPLAPGISYLEADLLYLAPELEPYGTHYLISDHSSEDYGGLSAYNELRVAAKSAGVLFCTHAMLAYDLLHQGHKIDAGDGVALDDAPRRRLLPEYKTILIDEAHLFERNIANVHTINLSILGLRSALKKSELGTAEARATGAALCTEIMDLSKELGAENRDRMYSPGALGNDRTDDQVAVIFRKMAELNGHLAVLMKTPKKKKSEEKASEEKEKGGEQPKGKPDKLPTMHFILGKIVACLKGTSRYPVLVNNTPISHWPVITTGKNDVSKDIAKIWKQVDGAVLVSATLSLPAAVGTGSGREHIRKLLNIPEGREYVAPPVIPQWVTDGPTLHISDDVLSYPSPNDYDPTEIVGAKEAWLQSAAEALLPAVGTAAGGTLVLLCSYEDVKRFGEYLSAQGLGRRLILKTLVSSMEKQKQQFKEMARAGAKPIWLAVGGAWTGLDLRDELVSDDEPEKDIILTDLVIPRFNFADNQTISHKFRSKRDYGATTFVEAAFTLRQGLGRLMRRPGLLNRRIWVFDTRIWIAGKRYNVFRRILSAYREA